MKLPEGVEIKTFKNKNTKAWEGKIAICWKFQLDKVDETRKIINIFNELCTFEKIDSEKSVEDDRKQAQRLIDEGSYSWSLDPENGTPFEKLPEEVQEEIGWPGSGRKWSKWTVEKLLQKWGWEEGEVYWFALSKDHVSVYPLILKDGDWICFCPALERDYHTFLNVGQDCKLPYSSDWEEGEL